MKLVYLFKFRRWKLGTIILGVLLISVSGCGKKQPPPPPPPQVTVARPLQRTVTDYLDLNGTTQAENSVQLVARVPGYLEKVLFRDGQLVKKGESLFIIQRNTSAFRLGQAEAQIQLQKAQLAYAGKQLYRFSKMLKQKAAAQSDVDNWRYQRDTALANLRAAKAQRDLARLDLGYTRVVAPFDGRIDRHLKDPGNLVGAGENTVLAELNQVDPIEVYFTVSDLDLVRLVKSVGGIPGHGSLRRWPVDVGLYEEARYSHHGYIDFAASRLTATTGTLLLRGILPNPSGAILPGLQARVRVPLGKRKAFLVPETAVGNDQQGAYLLVVNAKNVVERRGVTTGPIVDQLRAIEHGVQGNEWVVVKGLLRAAPGRQITPVREGGSAGFSELTSSRVSR